MNTIYEYGIDRKELMRINKITRKEADEYIRKEKLATCSYCYGLFPADEILRDDHFPDEQFCELCYKGSYKEIVNLFKSSRMRRIAEGRRFCDPAGVRNKPY